MKPPVSILIIRTTTKPGILILLLFMVSKSYSQQCDSTMQLKDSVWIKSLRARFGSLNFPGHDSIDTGGIDSLKSKTAGKLNALRDSAGQFLKKADSTKIKKAPLLYFAHGYIQYNMNYRSQIDTPYAESNIIQHTLLGSGDFIVGGLLPVHVTYLERQSNSALFADYRDVRADIDGPALQRLQKERLKQKLIQQVQRLEDSASLTALNAEQQRLKGYKSLLDDPKLVELLIQSKENIIHLDEHNGSCKWKDSLQYYSKKYIDLYESKESEFKKIEDKVDSLKDLYAKTRKKVQVIQKIINGHFNTGEGIEAIKAYLQQVEIDKNILPKYPGFLYSLQRFSVGRTMPEFSPLTVKNVNVKGINAEFGNGIWYAAVVAGIVDFRIRDFVTSKIKQSPQSVYAVKGGWGSRNGNHLFVTVYKGRKQIYSLTSPSTEISGASAELQYVILRNHRFSAEVAQSSTPVSPDSTLNKTTALKLRDLSGRAYHLEWNSYFPKWKSEIHGFYQKTGINFQSFNSYRVNAAAESWSLKYNQYFFGRLLRIDAGARKNEYTNPLITQNYNSNTVFKTVQATFRKRGLPSVSVGYIPSSQYAIVDSQVYESRYQTLTINVNHSYKVGTARATTNTFYSRFYNAGSDSGFVYYNANYISVLQEINFKMHSATAGVNITKNSQFTLIVMQIGASAIFAKKFQLEGGVKVNHFDSTLSKAGLYARTRVSVRWLGDLSAWYDDSYLPGIGKQLIRNQQFNISLFRYIK